MPKNCFLFVILLLGRIPEVMGQGTSDKTYQFLVNPIRSITDETSVYFECVESTKSTLGFSIGYIRPHLLFDGGSFRSLTFNDGNSEMRFESYGVALRGYKKLFKDRKYTAFVLQSRFIAVSDYYYVVGDHLSDDAIDVNVDQSTLILGFQVHKGIISSSEKTIFHQMQFGIGINAGMNLKTDYNHYSSIGRFETNVPSEYRLSRFTTIPTFHLAYNLGYRFRR